MSDIASDFIIRIKNAAMARRKTVALPYSKRNKAIGIVLAKEEFIKEIKEDEVDGKKTLTATLLYKKRIPTLTGVSIISKPSLRIYVKTGHVKDVERKRMSTAIFSTSKGVMTGKEADKTGVGGELLFEVW